MVTAVKEKKKAFLVRGKCSRLLLGIIFSQHVKTMKGKFDGFITPSNYIHNLQHSQQI